MHFFLVLYESESSFVSHAYFQKGSQPGKKPHTVTTVIKTKYLFLSQATVQCALTIHLRNFPTALQSFFDHPQQKHAETATGQEEQGRTAVNLSRVMGSYSK